MALFRWGFFAANDIIDRKSPHSDRTSGMNLRDHQLMCYRPIPNWPPVWICGAVNKRVTGEVGVLKRYDA